MRGATIHSTTGQASAQDISTHAPLAGRDRRSCSTSTPACANFNPRAPCGARHPRRSAARRSSGFQPTRPLRGATGGAEGNLKTHSVFQPTRPLRGATGQRGGGNVAVLISTHAPLAGRDSPLLRHSFGDAGISTHAPLAGRDWFTSQILLVRQ